ncbi:MAG: hypothetical protein K2K12_06510, partial [Clostridia bacterium]|nr:hypothetical protein [Clostridia bacterium]
LESCIHCGYKFNLQSVAIQPPVPEGTRLSPELEKAEQHAAEDIAYVKKLNRISNCAWILGMSMFIIAVVLFFVWDKSYNSLEQLVYYKRFHDAIYAMLILAGIVFLVEIIERYLKSYFAYLRIAKRLETEKADYLGYIRVHFSEAMKNDKMYSQINRFAHAVYLTQHPKEKLFTRAYAILELIAYILYDFFGDILVCILAGEAMNSVLLDSYSFDYGNLYWLIPIGIGAILMIVKGILNRPHAKSYDRWYSALTSGLEKSEQIKNGR